MPEAEPLGKWLLLVRLVSTGCQISDNLWSDKSFFEFKISDDHGFSFLNNYISRFLLSLYLVNIKCWKIKGLLGHSIIFIPFIYKFSGDIVYKYRKYCPNTFQYLFDQFYVYVFRTIVEISHLPWTRAQAKVIRGALGIKYFLDCDQNNEKQAWML